MNILCEKFSHPHPTMHTINTFLDDGTRYCVYLFTISAKIFGYCVCVSNLCNFNYFLLLLLDISFTASIRSIWASLADVMHQQRTHSLTHRAKWSIIVLCYILKEMHFEYLLAWILSVPQCSSIYLVEHCAVVQCVHMFMFMIPFFFPAHAI